MRVAARLPGVFRKHQRGAAMADGKIGLAERAGALRQLLLQRAVLHLVHEIERPRPDLGFARQGHILRGGGQADQQQCGEQGGATADGHGRDPG